MRKRRGEAERAERGREERKKIQAHHYTYQAAYSWFVRMAIKHFPGRTGERTVHRPSGTRTLGMTREIEGEALPGSPLKARRTAIGRARTREKRVNERARAREAET